jgi:hypothetical protein
MNIDQTPTAATNPSTTEDPKQQNNDNSNPQQGPGIVRRSASVATASHPHSDSASFTTVKKKDTRKLFVGGLPSDGAYVLAFINSTHPCYRQCSYLTHICTMTILLQ